MADEMLTLVDIAKMNGKGGLAELVDETIQAYPEIVYVPARTVKGTNYKSLVRTALPTTGFRAANQGANRTKGSYEERIFECFIFNPKWTCDKAVAMASEDGPEATLAMEADALLKGSWVTVAKQMYYGAAGGGDTLGHPGLLQMYDSANMLVDVNSSGATAGTGSSVWAVKFGPTDVQWIYGKDGDLGLSDVTEIQLADENNKLYTALHQEILAHVGLKTGSTKCIGRIRNLTADVNHTLDDDMMADLLAKFPVGIVPDAFFMTRRSLGQLQKSRTATNATGAPAPRPTEYEGIPILPTDAILDTETLDI